MRSLHRARRFPFPVILFVLAALGGSATAEELRTLSFEERVVAQEAIERVYYSHQIGATRPFEEAVPREVLERKVRTYLKQSVVLKEYWHTSVTAEMLEGELARVARSTRLPGRVLEIYRALGDDPFVVQECFARQVLVDRLSRNFFAFDRGLHRAERQAAEHLRGKLIAGEIDPNEAEPHRALTRIRRVADGYSARQAPAPQAAPAGERIAPDIELSPEEYERFRRRAPRTSRELGELRESRDAFTLAVALREGSGTAEIATYALPKMSWDAWWAEVGGRLEVAGLKPVARLRASLPVPGAPGLDRGAKRSTGSRTWGDPQIESFLSGSCVPDDTWDNGSLDDVPTGRSGHTAVWTGSLMIVWGGGNRSNTGGRYDPLIDTWTPTSTDGAPSGRADHTAVWTGSLMIVWGGFDDTFSNTNTGGRYDPLTDTWTPTSTEGAPSARSAHTAVWTGSLMLVWGAYDDPSSNTGGRYDPLTDTWTPTSTVGVPSARSDHSAVWTGSLMIVWGGWDDTSAVNTGGRYDPITDTWTPTSTAGTPSGRGDHTAVWTGSSMIVWGGYDYEPLNSGRRYDPLTDTWTPMSTEGAPAGRFSHTVVWTGTLMLVWGGFDGTSMNFDTGGRYDPISDRWGPVSTTAAPSARTAHTAVWTGELMVVWGGYNGASSDTGGRYDPFDDTWTPTSTGAAPSGRSDHTAVWTGNRMIVWGGYDGALSNTGGLYDPLTDTWTATAPSGAPSGRYLHTAVWTGSVMVVWGGAEVYRSNRWTDTGGRYDPLTDTWAPTELARAPSARALHSAVWTGNLMLVWGGYNGTFLGTGGRYDPLQDSWAPTVYAGAPSGRDLHTAIWTGSLMVVWGGYNNAFLNTGGRYDPLIDAWTPTSTDGAPSTRAEHTAVWTGNLMVVWGGVAGHLYRITGGRYDPLTDSWTRTSTADAPSGRTDHTAVWTGSLMVVWGGADAIYPYFMTNTGGRYDPLSDAWTSTSIAGAPSDRYLHTAVWTGSVMVVWGGTSSGGGRYAIGEAPDLDGDGYSACAGDCDDQDPTIHPAAPEVCDGLDNNCDGSVDESGDALCDDHDICNGVGICAGNAGCQQGTSLNCDDGNPCSVDSCGPSSGCSSTASDPSCQEPKGQGYYKRLCRSEHPEEELTQANVECASDSATFSSVSTIPELCVRLAPDPSSDKCEQAEAQLMAALLNRCKARITDGEAIDSTCSGHAAVGGSIADADSLLSNTARTRDDCERAQCEAEEINSGAALAPQLTVDLDAEGGVRLRWTQPPGSDTSAPPSRYDIWRRAHGTVAFSRIATVEELSFVDPESGSGESMDYQVTATK